MWIALIRFNRQFSARVDAPPDAHDGRFSPSSNGL
jgi:hypothetical protein